MGNCCDRYCCFGRYGKRKYLRTRYNVERDFSIEFENLMDGDETQQEDIASTVTPRERLLLANKEYGSLIEEQKQKDAEIDAKLVQQEEELRMEEEAYYEARREAARAAKKQQINKAMALAKTTNSKQFTIEEDSDWELGGGDDDFEAFLENVKKRSIAARTRAISSQVAVDQQSTSSVASKDRADDASSLDLEWEHEAGLQPIPKRDHRTDRNKDHDKSDKLTELALRPNMLELNDTHSAVLTDEFEWDSDLEMSDAASLQTAENVTLLTNSSKKVKR